MKEIIKVFDCDKYSELLPGINVLQLNNIPENEAETPLPLKLEELTVSNSLICSYCKTNFDNCVKQRQHYKSDWHRYNIKQSLKCAESLSEERFEQLADDVSSISGSDTSDDNSEQSAINQTFYQGRIYFKNEFGKVFSIYRSLIHEKKDAPVNDESLFQIVKQCGMRTIWTLLMLGGGHFAGAVFDGSKVVISKTFHLYTCRAKQGGAQFKEASAKSAGASLRRYNEFALNQRVGELLKTWSSHIQKSNIIFYRAAGPYNRNVLFGGKLPALNKNDSRLRIIPFCTKRATLTELKRVHELLTNVEIYDSIESLKSQYFIKKNEESDSVRQSRRESPSKNKNIDRAKSREAKELVRPIPCATEEDTSSDNCETEINLTSDYLELSFNDLKEYGNSLTKEEQKKKVIKKRKLKKKDRIKKWEENLKRELNNACIKGNLEMLQGILNAIKKDTTENEDNQMTPLNAVNLPIDEHGNTVLHLAALNNHNEMIVWLLENSSSPCNKNDKLHTPYTVNSDKSVRNVFRNFATDNPEKYNYSKSQIPITTSILSKEELSEKKKAVRKAKKEREKEKRMENEIKRKEEEDKNRYLNLSDREKRALAAERRILAQTVVVLVRCFLCGEDISGKVPFEYSGNRFCSITCLKAHRMQSPVSLSN